MQIIENLNLLLIDHCLANTVVLSKMFENLVTVTMRCILAHNFCFIFMIPTILSEHFFFISYNGYWIQNFTKFSLFLF